MPQSEPAAVAHGLVRVYVAGTGEVHALRGVDLVVPGGEVTAVVGPSGSGKSTLLQLLALEDRPTAGRLEVAGTRADGARERVLRHLRRKRIGLVRQRPTHNLFAHLTAHEHVEQVAALRGAADVVAEEVLGAVGLTEAAGRRPGGLSGGEQQRLAVALASLGTPTLLLADEPTAELDPVSAAAVLDLLHAAAGEGSGVLVNTHDLAVAARADRVVTLRHGAVTSEHRAGSGALGVIDASGRIQLPPEALERFPAGRARVEVRDDVVVLHPPPEGE